MTRSGIIILTAACLLSPGSLVDMPGYVPGALSAAAEMPDSNAKPETVTGTDAADGK